MNISTSVLIVAEVGKKVGWGHVARAQLLKQILSRFMAVTVKVVNREPWQDAALESEFALCETVDADIVFLDGLSVTKEMQQFVRAPRMVSLSYISDVNDQVDYVVAPALNGMQSPANFITDLSAMLCNNPEEGECVDSHSIQSSRCKKTTVGVCMGGGDADGVAPEIVEALSECGYSAFVYPPNIQRNETLNDFLSRKLKSDSTQPFPYAALVDCQAVICQGGLSAVELALMGMPTVVRRRTAFSEAYHFLYQQGCALSSKENTIPALTAAVQQIVQDKELQKRMSLSGRALNARCDEIFWLRLINRLMRV